MPPARQQRRPVLLDDLPNFLKAVEAGLGRKAQHQRYDRIDRTRKSSAGEHGQKRAKTPEYRLEEVLSEYKILRRTLMQIFSDCKVRIDIESRQYLHFAIDEAMEEAARRFVEYRTDQLKMVVSRLEVEKQLREHFVSTLTHDLRTPLATIRASAELMRRGGSADTLQGATLTDRIVTNADRIDDMIQDLLDASLVQAGKKLPLAVESNDLRKLANEVIDEMARLHGHRFSLSGEESVCGFWATGAIRRSIENLLNNAVKYGDPVQNIDVRVWKSGESAFLSVRNFGSPIPKSDLSLLFERFRRTHAAQRSGKMGWGLGLTIVRGIVESHGGSVSVTSALETGTTFTLQLPIDSRDRSVGLPEAA